MVQAIQTRNTKWLNENVSSETLIAYKAYAVWIFDRNADLLYSRRADQDKPDLEGRNQAVPPPLPMPQEAFQKLFAKEPAAHFFVKLDGEVMEIRAATVPGSGVFPIAK